MNNLATQEPRVGTRSADRVRMDAVIDARSGQSRLRLEVLDCSATGFRVRSLSPLRLGMVMWAKLPGLQTKEAEIVWVDGFLSGCAFREPIDERVFKTMLRNGSGNACPEIVDRRSVSRPV